MHKLCVALATLCALTTMPSVAAERAEFQISPRAGRGVLKLDQFRNVDENLAELDTGGLGVAFAVRSASSSSSATAGISCRSSGARSGRSAVKTASCCCTTTTSSAATGNFWEVGFGKRVNDVMSLGGSVRSGDYEFGDAGSVAFVMTFRFERQAEARPTAFLCRMSRPLAMNTTCSAMFLA